jgi:3-oxoadipate enol-lactonase/4-carboxymuconolactone decarboxylase
MRITVALDSTRPRSVHADSFPHIMPLLNLGHTTCYYRLSGREELPVLMLAHSLGQDHGMWDAQAEDLSAQFRVLRYDIRGHGASSAPAGDYRVEELAADALALAQALGIERFAFCGLSLGGMIGQWLAAHAPDRIVAAVLANTSARPDAVVMEARRQTVLGHGIAAVADTVMGRFFSPRLLADPVSPAVATARRTLLATDPVGYAGCCAAVRDMDQTSALSGMRVPVLVIDGELDVSLPWTGHGDRLAREIPGARVVHLAAAHLSNIETPRSFTAALRAFLLPPPAAAPEIAGMVMRRAVLGDAHVDKAIAAAPAAAAAAAGASPSSSSSSSGPSGSSGSSGAGAGAGAGTSQAFQDLITRYAWGTIWTRPGLDIRTRRLLVLAMTAATGRWEEFRLHVRTGFQHELEWCDLEEVLMQAAIYAGVPAANTGFHVAADERLGVRNQG